MDNKKLYEELLKADGINPAGATESERIAFGKMLDEQSKTKQSTLSFAQPDIWRKIMRSSIVKLAAAAVIIIAVIAGISLFEKTSSIALADVIQKINQVRNFSYTSHTIKKNIPNMPPDQTDETHMKAYAGADFGLRIDMEHGGPIRTESYILPTTKKIITVIANIKKYTVMNFSDEWVASYRKKIGDPKLMIEQFQQVKHTNLGKSNINGIEVIGLGTTDVNYAGKAFENVKASCWFDTKTELPVQIETECYNNDGSSYIKTVVGDFKWNIELDSSFFEPNIPSDYVLMSEIQVPSGNDIETVVKGFRVFAKWTGGKYPSTLSPMLLGKGTVQVMREYLDPAKSEPNKQEMDGILQVNMLSALYTQLIQEKKDPAYYGNAVTALDPDAVLMRWSLDNGSYRVIYGDLSSEDVNSTELAELEAKNPKEIMHEIKPPRPAIEFAGNQLDRWHLDGTENITAHSSLTITNIPLGGGKMIIELPYADAKIQSAKYAGTQVQFNDLGNGKYEMIPQAEGVLQPNTTLEVIWTIPLSKLEKGESYFRAELKGLIPVYSYSLDFILDENCGYENTADPNVREIHPFKMSNPKAQGHIGSCGLMIRKTQ